MVIVTQRLAAWKPLSPLVFLGPSYSIIVSIEVELASLLPKYLMGNQHPCQYFQSFRAHARLGREAFIFAGKVHLQVPTDFSRSPLCVLPPTPVPLLYTV